MTKKITNLLTGAMNPFGSILMNSQLLANCKIAQARSKLEEIVKQLQNELTMLEN
jgi:hypothetical protein